MAAVAGYTGQVKIGANILAQVFDAELPIAGDMYETTVLNGGRAKTYIPGLYGAMFNLKLNWDASDTNGLIALQSNLLAASPTILAFTLSPNGGTNNYTFSGWVKDLKVHDAVNGKIESDCSVQVSGAVAYA